MRNGTHDLAEGKPIYYIKVEDVPSGTKLLLGHQEILIGATGYYEAFYEEPMYNLRVSSINVDESNITEPIQSTMFVCYIFCRNDIANLLPTNTGFISYAILPIGCSSLK